MKFENLLLQFIKQIYYHTTIPRLPAVLACIPRYTSLKEVFNFCLRPFQKQPILLLSYPRSGSSWLGEVLSYSPDIYYLREPVTQTLGQKHDYYALINPDMDLKTLLLYIKFADLSFTGLPAKGVKHVIFNDHNSSIQDKYLLIKEVNILAIDLFIKRYNPFPIILIRHPAAIADSFHRMGWLTKGWKRFGFEYGKRMQTASNLVQEYPSRIIQFESIATSPQELIPKLFRDLNISTPPDLEEIIRSYTRKHNVSTGPYQTKRISKSEVNKWKSNLPENRISQLKEGYLKADFSYYRTDSDW
jgi:hypothetical protein